MSGWLRDGMALGWIGLFAFRWAGVPLLLRAGLLPPERVETLDAALLKIYWMLVAVTLLTLALRWIRSRTQAATPIAANAPSAQSASGAQTGDVPPASPRRHKARD